MRRTLVFAFAITTLLVGAGFASAATGGPDAYGYTWDDSEAYVWNDISGTGTQLAGGDEDVSALIGLGFSFVFYGTTYSQTQIAVNGHVTFAGSTSYELTCDWDALPIKNWAGKWADLVTSSAGAIYYQTTGSAPNRKFVVQYQAVPIYGEDTNVTTFQIVLEEGTNDIVFYVQDGLANPANANQLFDATGIASTDDYLQYSCDSAIAASKAIRYSHPTDFFQVKPAAANGAGAPGATVTYTVSVFNFLGASTDFDIAYTGNSWTTNGDATITVANAATGTFDVTVEIPAGADFGDTDTVSVDVSDGTKVVHSAVLTTTASCDLMVDDGSYEVQIGFNSSNIGMCATVFTVTEDTDITNVKVMFSAEGGITTPAPFKVCFFAASVAGGPTGAAHDCSGPYTADDLDAWYEVDLPSAVAITAGDFAVATWQTGSFYSQGIDQNGPRAGRGWVSVDTGSSWDPQDTLSGDTFAGNFLIRPSFCEVIPDDDDDDDDDDNDDNDDDTVDDDATDDDATDDDATDDDVVDDDNDTTDDDDDDDDDLADDDAAGDDDDDDDSGCGC